MKILIKSNGFSLIEILIAMVIGGIVILGMAFLSKTIFFDSTRATEDDEVAKTQLAIRNILSRKESCKNTLSTLDFNNNTGTDITIKNDHDRVLFREGDIYRGLKIGSIKAFPGGNAGTGLFLSRIEVSLLRDINPTTTSHTNLWPPLPTIKYYFNVSTTSPTSGAISSCQLGTNKIWQLVRVGQAGAPPVSTNSNPPVVNPIYKEFCVFPEGGKPKDLGPPPQPPYRKSYDKPWSQFTSACYVTGLCEGTADCFSHSQVGIVDCPTANSGLSSVTVAQGNMWQVSASIGIGVGGPSHLGRAELWLHNFTRNEDIKVGGIGQSGPGDPTLTMPVKRIDNIQVGESYSFFTKLTLLTSNSVDIGTLTPEQYPYICAWGTMIFFQEYVIP